MPGCIIQVVFMSSPGAYSRLCLGVLSVPGCIIQVIFEFVCICVALARAGETSRSKV